MARTLLELLQDAAGELGIQQPIQIIGNLDAQIIQLLALAQREGLEFASAATGDGGWPQMRKEHTFLTVDGQAAYDFPEDLQFFLVETDWDRTNRWQLLGPLSAQEWQVLKSGITVVGPRKRFRIMDGQMYLDPTPSASDAGCTIAYEYISTGWCESAAGDPQTRWAADTDTYVLDENCFVLGVKWRFLRAKGLDYTEEKSSYDLAVERAKSRAGSGRSLSINSQATGMRLLSNANIPDTGFGQ